MYGGVNLFHFTGGPCAELVALGHARASGAREFSTIVAAIWSRQPRSRYGEGHTSHPEFIDRGLAAVNDDGVLSEAGSTGCERASLRSVKESRMNLWRTKTIEQSIRDTEEPTHQLRLHASPRLPQVQVACGRSGGRVRPSGVRQC